MKLSLKNKLSLAIISSILFFGVIAIVFVFFQTRDTFISQAKKNLVDITVAQAYGVDAVFNGANQLVETIAKQDDIIDYMQSNYEIQDVYILNHLESYNIGDIYSSIYIMAPDGTTLVSTDPTFVGKNYDFRDYFKKAMEGEAWVDVAIGVTSKKAGYYFSYPIKSFDNTIVGVVIAKMKPEYVYQFFSSHNIFSDASLMFSDSEGIIIYSNDTSKIYKSLGYLDEETQDRVAEKKRFSGMVIEPLGYDIIQNELSQIEDAQVFEFYDENNKENKVITIVRIKGKSFYIIIEQESDVFVKISIYIAAYLALFVFIAACVAILCIIFFVNKFLKPLKSLKEGAYQLSQENFDYRIDVKSGDEFEELAHIFNDMSHKLKDIYKDLENKLKKLKKLNKLMVGREFKMKELKEKIDELESHKK